jgi:hypothetical protein
MNESGHLLDACPRGGYARLAAEFLKVRDDLFRMIVDILKNGTQIAVFVHDRILSFLQNSPLITRDKTRTGKFRDCIFSGIRLNPKPVDCEFAIVRKWEREYGGGNRRPRGWAGSSRFIVVLRESGV